MFDDDFYSVFVFPSLCHSRIRPLCSRQLSCHVSCRESAAILDG